MQGRIKGGAQGAGAPGLPPKGGLPPEVDLQLKLIKHNRRYLSKILEKHLFRRYLFKSAVLTAAWSPQKIRNR